MICTVKSTSAISGLVGALALIVTVPVRFPAFRKKVPVSGFEVIVGAMRVMAGRLVLSVEPTTSNRIAGCGNEFGTVAVSKRLVLTAMGTLVVHGMLIPGLIKIVRDCVAPPTTAVAVTVTVPEAVPAVRTFPTLLGAVPMLTPSGVKVCAHVTATLALRVMGLPKLRVVPFTAGFVMLRVGVVTAGATVKFAVALSITVLPLSSSSARTVKSPSAAPACMLGAWEEVSTVLVPSKVTFAGAVFVIVHRTCPPGGATIVAPKVPVVLTLNGVGERVMFEIPVTVTVTKV